MLDPSPAASRALALTLLLAAPLAACQRHGQAELHLALTHPDLPTLKAVLIERFREANAHKRLRLSSARATEVFQTDRGAALHLDLVVETAGPCTEDALPALLDKARGLATGAAELAVYAPSGEGAKDLAEALRATLGRDVLVPFDRKGLVITALSPEEQRARTSAFESAHPTLRVLSDPGASTADAVHLWVVAHPPALTSADLVQTPLSTRERPSVDLVVKDHAVATLRELTAAHKKHPIPIALDGVIALAPTVTSRAAEGRLRLELPPEALPLAERLASATLSTAAVPIAQRATCRPNPP